MQAQGAAVLREATAEDRQVIYRLRHDVYALELGQHAAQGDARLTDPLDALNLYWVAEVGGQVAGFVSITPPDAGTYSLDKYIPRAHAPFAFDGGLYEVRLLTVAAPFRQGHLAHALMLAALRAVQARGGTRIVAIGRSDLMDFYRNVGLVGTGIPIRSGAVHFELMHAEVTILAARAADFLANQPALLGRFRIEQKQEPEMGAIHGGGAFHWLGQAFEHLERRPDVVPADILDAWFDPAPDVVAFVAKHLPWAMKASPPIMAEGLVQAIAHHRGVPAGNLVAGAGSSALIHLGLRAWLRPASRVLVLDPTYSEYPHLLRSVGCHVERLALEESTGFQLDLDRLQVALAKGFDWVILVNPNNPTGQVVATKELQAVLAAAPAHTRFWIDETYIDFALGQDSLEPFAAASANIVVCKSMSKAYALSGGRVAYLCGPSGMLRALAAQLPPWAVSTPAQMAACAALQAEPYYAARWRETARYREGLAIHLRALGWLVHASTGNFLLCRIPSHHGTAAEVAERAAKEGVFLRQTWGMGDCLGPQHLRVAVRGPSENARVVAVLTGIVESKTIVSPA